MLLYIIIIIIIIIIIVIIIINSYHPIQSIHSAIRCKLWLLSMLPMFSSNRSELPELQQDWPKKSWRTEVAGDWDWWKREHLRQLANHHQWGVTITNQTSPFTNDLWYLGTVVSWHFDKW